MKHIKKDIITLTVLLLITIGALLQLPKITVDGSTDIFIPNNHEITIINDLIEEEFGSIDSVLMGVQVKFGTVLEAEILALINTLTTELEKLKDVDNVISLTNMDYIMSTAEGMEVLPLLDDLSPEGIEVTEERLTDWQEMYFGNIISDDLKLTVIFIQPLRENDQEANQRIYEKVKVLARQYQSANIVFPITGMPVIMEEISRSILSDLGYLIPLVTILILVILFISFRRWEAVVYPLISLAIACIWTIGVMALFDMTFTMASMLVPILLLAVGSAYGIHLLNHFYGEISFYEGFISTEKVYEILKMTIVDIRGSIILAGATTAGGFISYLSSPLGPFKSFGLLSALGIIFSQITMFLVIPTLLRLQYRSGINADKFRKSDTSIKRNRTSVIFSLFNNIATQHKVFILFISISLVILTVSLFPHVKVGINSINFFKKDSTIVQDVNIFNDNLSGTGTISVFIQAPEKGDILRPEFLITIKEFETYIQVRNPVIGGISSLVPSIERINKILNFNRKPYQINEETEAFDFFANDSFHPLDDESPIETSGEVPLKKQHNPIEINQQLKQALIDAGPDAGIDEIINSFLALNNFQGEAFNEIPLVPEKYGLTTHDDLQDLLSQYLIIYSGSLDMIINDSLEPDRTLITIQVTKEDTMDLKSLMEDISAFWDYYTIDGWNYAIGGATTRNYALSTLVTRSQVLSLLGALFIVFFIVSMMFRSLLAGLISTIPVLFGITGIFLFMIVFNFRLDIVTSLLASMAIGIGVDYAIHFMNAYKRCLRQKKENVLNAVYRSTGKAIFVNAFSVSSGFLGLIISQFIPIQQLGLLFSIAMLFSSTASLIVLPMVLEHFKPSFLDRHKGGSQ